jgi:hypothetical protein
MNKLLPNFIEGLAGTLKTINVVLREQYDKRVREGDMFFQANGNIGRNPVSIDQLLQFYESFVK